MAFQTPHIVVGQEAPDHAQHMATDINAALSDISKTLAEPITNAQLADMAQGTVKGRALATGTGSPVDLTAVQQLAIVAGAGLLTNIRVFTANDTYPASTATIKVLVYCKGGGGGGATGTLTEGGGGGGEGEESWKLTTAAALSGQTVTVGAVGTGQIANNTNPGGTGGTSAIGAIVTALGGVGGVAADSNGLGGAGGSGGTRDWGMPGARGHSGTVATSGLFLWAPGGGKGGGAGGTGNGVANSGGGGGNGNSGSAGGNGGTGIVVCYEFGTI